MMNLVPPSSFVTSVFNKFLAINKEMLLYQVLAFLEQLFQSCPYYRCSLIWRPSSENWDWFDEMFKGISCTEKSKDFEKRKNYVLLLTFITNLFTDERKNSNNNSLDLIKLISVNSDDRIKIIIGYAFDTIINYTSPTLQIHDDATCMLNFLNEMCQSIWISPDNYSRRETLLGILSTQYNNLPKLEHKIYFLKKLNNPILRAEIINYYLDGHSLDRSKSNNEYRAKSFSFKKMTFYSLLLRPEKAKMPSKSISYFTRKFNEYYLFIFQIYFLLQGFFTSEEITIEIDLYL